MADAKMAKRKWIKPSQGGKLSTAQRDSMPASEFALPGKGDGPEGKGSGSYPIPDASHGRNALARVAQHGTEAEKSKVRAAVHRKFPGIGAASKADRMYGRKSVRRM